MGRRYKLKDYNRDDLKEVQKNEFAVGSYGDVKLLYDKKLKKYVVGKIFQSSGEMRKVNQDFSNARREARILAQFQHKNIVAVLGATMWDKRSFTIILEYAPNGNLESLLLQDKDIPLPWKLRARFFTELANALDYLHNHDPNRSYIHGDLKPQNVLVGNLLVIKLADFGAATINKYTGASTLDISGEDNTQHTPYYTAPEFLKDTSKPKRQSMDVYSFGMIGYEILTRKAVYSGASVSSAAVLSLIKLEGQKPDVTIMNQVETSLKEISNDSQIFGVLVEIVKQSWETDPEDRPKIADVKKKLTNLAQSKKIYDKATNEDAEAVVERRKKVQPTPSFQKEQSSKTTAIKRRIKNAVIFAILPMLGLFAALTIRNLDSNADAFQSGFLGIDDYGKLVEYNVFTNSFSVSSFKSCNTSETLVFFFDSHSILKASEMVYAFGWNRDTRSYFALKLNLSDSLFACWEELVWETKYGHRKYITFKGNILGIGAEDYFYIDDSGKDYANGTNAVDLFNTTTGDWTSLQPMNEPRIGHSLVSFQGLICAIGGLKLNSSECYDPKANKWTYLPRMETERGRTSAVELNDELYVSGGKKKSGEVDKLRSVEKYNPDLETWVKVAPMKKGRSSHASGVFNGKIYVIGGGSDLVEAYDPSNNVWEVVDKVEDSSTYMMFTAV